MRTTKKIKLQIKTKIVILYMFLSILLLSILVPAVVVLMEGSEKSNLSVMMRNANEQLVNNLTVQDGTVKISESFNEDELPKNGIFIRVLDEDGSIVWQSYAADDEFELLSEYHAKTMLDSSTVIDTSYGPIYVEVLGDLYFNRYLSRLSWILYIIIPSYILLASIGAYILARNSLRPIAQIAKTARKIKAGDLSKRITDVCSRDEVGDLANTFNEMIDEIELSIKREKQFTSDASHELRTPISVVNACAEEALSTSDQTIIRENLETIKSENIKMAKIISQLLMLSRGYEGRYHFKLETIDLRDTVESVAEIAEIEARGLNILIHDDVPEGMNLVADQNLFTQVLMNLIGNAVKYGTECGNVWISAEFKDGFVWTIVKDDGIGISDENLCHIFERFYRADSSRDRNGSGLGLSIVKWIIEMHHGKIDVSSEIGRGSEFRIGIPGKEAGK